MEIKDITTCKRIHFTGIKGIAMASLASVCTSRGIVVTGSDVPGHFPTDEILENIHVHVWENFSKEHIEESKPDVVIYTGAHHGIENPEVEAAQRVGIPVIPHGKALGLFMASQKRISIAGCHGKTTTSAMVSTILTLSNEDPSYAVGCGWIFPIGVPGRTGRGTWFVAEADEYVTDPAHDKTPRFMWQKPDICCITNIDFDHPDVYDTIDDIKIAYQKLVDTVSKDGYVVCNGDDQMSEFLTAKATMLRVGKKVTCDYVITNEKFSEKRTSFDLLCPDKTRMTIFLGVPGNHNISNAAQAAVVSLLIGCKRDDVVRSLALFTGTRRRFELIKESEGISYYDDYAHHPHEIEATLKAARLWFPNRRIIVVFEPHTYSRTKALLNEFGTALSNADIAIVSAIYASARENDTLGVTGKDIVSEIQKHSQHAVYKETADSIRGYLKDVIKPGDVVIFMGAGDIYLWSRKVVENISL
jgi:UDP-N-acetylmuramate--alanine ligase